MSMLFSGSEKCLTDRQHPLHTERDVKKYTCPVGITKIINGTEFTNSSFNEGKMKRLKEPLSIVLT